MIIGNKMAETVMQPVFEVDGIPFFPHFAEKHRWVGPGPLSERKVFTTRELVEDMKAQKKFEHLWPRSWTDEVK